MKLQAEMNGDEKAYLATIEEIEKLFPNDPALDLISIDGLYLRKNFAELDKVVDGLDRRLGGDAYLDLLRGGFWLEAEDLDRASKHYRRAIERDPTMVDAWWSLITIALQGKDWKETGRLLSVIERDLKIALPDLEQTPDYAEFVKSADYADWKKARSAK
jgi:tetratricopeptide (TPR) repeat protein